MCHLIPTPDRQEDALKVEHTFTSNSTELTSKQNFFVSFKPQEHQRETTANLKGKGAGHIRTITTINQSTIQEREKTEKAYLQCTAEDEVLSQQRRIFLLHIYLQTYNKLSSLLRFFIIY